MNNWTEYTPETDGQAPDGYDQRLHEVEKYFNGEWLPFLDPYWIGARGYRYRIRDPQAMTAHEQARDKAAEVAQDMGMYDLPVTDGEYEAFMAGWNCCSDAADDDDPKLPDEYWAELDFDSGAQKPQPITDGEIEAAFRKGFCDGWNNGLSLDENDPDECENSSWEKRKAALTASREYLKGNR